MTWHKNQTWREMSETEFRAWLASRTALEARPPVSVKNVNHREWSDLSLGGWPDNVVAKMTRRPRGKGAVYQFRLLR
jgi:spore cortex formation protein SpoVR/YcgB (stage V sporulation)